MPKELLLMATDTSTWLFFPISICSQFVDLHD